MPRFGLAADIQAHPDDAPGVARVDDTIIPQACGSEQRRGLGRVGVDDLPRAGIQGLRVGFSACPARAFLGDNGHHLGRLLAPHYRDAVVGPGKDEPRIEGAPAHAVITRSK